MARVGARPGLRPQGQVPRRGRHHREPAAIHRKHARTDRALLHVQRCILRRDGLRGPVDRGPDGHHGLRVLDPQGAGGRFMSSDYEEAIAAAGKAKALLWSSDAHIQLLDYHYYSALALAAGWETAPLERQREWRGLLTAHEEQLREWADNYPPTFGDKYALVSAEIARLEGRDADAMRLYEQAIRWALAHGFAQNEGLAHEVAARFYAARGVETIAHAYLRNARRCYLRWGALGKGRQLERLTPWLAEESAASVPSATINAPVEQLDLDTVVKASQAVSGEIELGKLTETLLRIA